MKEIEAKILEVDRAKIEKALGVLGAKKVFEGLIQTSFFDFSDGRIRGAGSVLRLRQEGGRTELTYKKVQFARTAKLSKEYSVEISSRETMQEILSNLGLAVNATTIKHRVSYILDEARFDIDKYTGVYGFIPEFLEIEASTPDSIHKYAGMLGFSAKDCLPWSTTVLIQHYADKSKQQTTDV